MANMLIGNPYERRCRILAFHSSISATLLTRSAVCLGIVGHTGVNQVNSTRVDQSLTIVELAKHD